MIAASGLTAAALHAALHTPAQHVAQLGEDTGTGGAGEA